MLRINYMMDICNEPISVQFITFVIYFFLFLYCSECESVEIKQMPVVYEG